MVMVEAEHLGPERWEEIAGSQRFFLSGLQFHIRGVNSNTGLELKSGPSQDNLDQ